jgi:hypothetical protein
MGAAAGVGYDHATGNGLADAHSAVLAARLVCRPIERGPIERGPIERGPIERGPIERGPIERGPIERGPIERGPIERGPIGPGPEAAAPQGTTGMSVEEASALAGFLAQQDEDIEL